MSAIRAFLDTYSKKSGTPRAPTKGATASWCGCARATTCAGSAARGGHPGHQRLPVVSGEPSPFDHEYLLPQGWKHQPFRKPLSTESVKHTLTVLFRMFTAMRELRRTKVDPYCMFNPVKMAHEGMGKTAPDEEVEGP